MSAAEQSQVPAEQADWNRTYTVLAVTIEGQVFCVNDVAFNESVNYEQALARLYKRRQAAWAFIDGKLLNRLEYNQTCDHVLGTAMD